MGVRMNEFQKKVSVIVPVYNAGTLLVKCIDSILKQTHRCIQLILIDDGSTDHSLEICEYFAKKDNRIEVYHIANSGSVAARKYGLRFVQGEYIAFVDADDYLAPDRILSLLSVITKSNADFVHAGHMEETDRNKNVVCDFSEVVVELDSVEKRIRFLQKYVLDGAEGNYISYSIWSKLFKSNFIKKCFENLEDEQQYGEDLLCLFRCILESKRIVLSKNTMYHYVVRSNSLSHLRYEEYMAQEIKLWHCILKLLGEYQCLETTKDTIYGFIKRRMLSVLTTDIRKVCPIQRYYYKDIDKIMGKDVILYGAGNVGQDYYVQISKYDNCNIVAWIDANSAEYHFRYTIVRDVKSILSLQFDMIIVAVLNEKARTEIINSLVGMGVSREKIDWQVPGVYF